MKKRQALKVLQWDPSSGRPAYRFHTRQRAQRAIPLSPPLGIYALDQKGRIVPVHTWPGWARWLQTTDRHVAETWVGDARILDRLSGV